MKKTVKEWNVDSIWGKIAMVSWGNPTKPPILLVHGYMDSAATFILLVDRLPDTHYYVGFDMPGHGKSEPFPPGLVPSQLNIVEIIRLVVNHMKWDQFIFMAHSMGFVIGAFYNHLFPGQITKMIHIDPAMPLAVYYYLHYQPANEFHYIYEGYYSNYKNLQGSNKKELTFDEAVNILVRNRSLTEEQAETVISRSLIPVGENKYRLSWDSRMKKISSNAISEETLFAIITQHSPPTLILAATLTNSARPSKKFAAKILEKLCMVPNFHSVSITGGHDLHITQPETIVPHIEEFLKSNNNLNVVHSLKAKL